MGHTRPATLELRQRTMRAGPNIPYTKPVPGSCRVGPRPGCGVHCGYCLAATFLPGGRCGVAGVYIRCFICVWRAHAKENNIHNEYDAIQIKKRINDKRRNNNKIIITNNMRRGTIGRKERKYTEEK